jgi:uncharacterized phage protein gp47/JayE
MSLQTIRDFAILAFNNFSLGRLNLKNPGTAIYNVVNSFAAMLVENQGAIDVGLNKLDPSLATGDDLDLIADNYGIERNIGSASAGFVSLWVYETSEDIYIPAGTAVYTTDGNTFTTIRDAVIPSDPGRYPASNLPDYEDLDASPLKNTNQRFYALILKEGVLYDPVKPPQEQFEPSRQIPVESIVIGVSQNIDAGEITDTDAGLGGVNFILSSDTEEFSDNGVYNDAPFEGGSDPEDDEKFRARILNHLSGTSTTTKRYLENIGRDFNGIDDAKILEPEDPKAGIVPPPGSVYLMVASSRAAYNPRWAVAEPEVTFPSSFPNTLKEQIRNKVEDARSVGVGVIIKESQIVNINAEQVTEDADKTVLIFVKPGTDLLTYTNIVSNQINTLLQSYKIGQDVYKSDIVESIRKIDQIVDISPFEVLGKRWDVETNREVTTLGSLEGADKRRDAIVIGTHEIARPDVNFNFRLVHDDRID